MGLNYCYVDSIQHEEAFFIDYSFTAKTSDRQDRDLRKAINQAYKNLPPNGQLSIFTTARDNDSTVIDSPAFSQCRPPINIVEQTQIDGADKTRPQLNNDNDEALQSFEAGIDQIMADAKDPNKVALHSPIFKTIRGISRYYSPGTLDAFHMYSDGIENSRYRQFCTAKGHLPTFEKFARSPDYQYLKPEPLDGVKVTIWLIEILQLPQPGMDFCTNRELREFWPAFFSANGSTPDIEPLDYGG